MADFSYSQSRTNIPNRDPNRDPNQYLNRDPNRDPNWDPNWDQNWDQNLDPDRDLIQACDLLFMLGIPIWIQIGYPIRTPNRIRIDV